ncbi:hypothetical protein D3C87_235040 [compost metagenome]
MNRSTQISYYLGFLFAFSYVIIRGFTVGMTHDEALTYKIISGDEVLRGTANHHWLNTQLSSFTSHLFGAKEFALRLPNILSFAVFWFFLFRISKEVLKSPFTQIALLLLLCGNPFILDFFSLCRGYGLSIACITASLFYLFRIVNLQTETKASAYFLAAVFAVLALSANLNTLNFFLVSQALVFLLLVVFKPEKWVLILCTILIFSGITLYFSLDQLFYLKDHNELYFGTGTLNTATDNLIHSSFYLINGFSEVIVLRYLLYAGLLFAIFQCIRRKQLFSPGVISLVIFVGILLALIAEHYLFDALYPINRSLLYLYPVVVLALLLSVDGLKSKIGAIGFAICSGLFIFFNLPSYNLQNTMTWLENKHIKDAMLFIKREVPDHSVRTVECKWIYEPIINYYRLEYQVPIQEVFREDLKYQADYLFTNPFDGENNSGQIDGYLSVFMHRGECGLFFYKRKPIEAN